LPDIDRKGPVTLIILDGWGLRDERRGNAVRLAHTPTMDALMDRRPWTRLQAHGEVVGLLRGQMGNSNVGHLNLGAGRTIYQDVARISRDIGAGGFFDKQALRGVMERARRRGSRLHLMGLLSDGGVHSHIDHLFALIDLARDIGPDRVAVHCFLDGRDVPPKSALKYIEALTDYLDPARERVAGVMGRYYGMDRDRRWDRTERAYAALVSGRGRRADDPRAAVRAACDKGETDEFVRPTLVAPQGTEPITLQDGDALIFFNFRADRARQITRALFDAGFDAFERTRLPEVDFCGLAQYDESFDLPYVYGRQHVADSLGEVVARHGLRQLRIAETEKYAHVTYFFSGGREEEFEGERRILIPSPQVATYDEKPEMSAHEVTDAVCREIAAGGFDLVVLNYANPDMLGHTGILEAAVAGVEAVDRCLGRTLAAVEEARGSALVVSDHGNAEQMEDESGEPHTAHTTSPVPCILAVASGHAGPGRNWRRLRPGGTLGNVAPTLLELLGLDIPEEMFESLLED